MRAARAAHHLYSLARSIKTDPLKQSYMDLALSPALEEDLDELELFNQSGAARHAVQHERHMRELTKAANH